MTLTGRSALLHPVKKSHIYTAKALGGFMWFWIFWRLKHDWSDFVGHHEEVFAGIEERKQKILAQRKAAEK